MTLSFSSRPPAPSPAAPDPDLSGFLLVDKPPAHTSHDVVARVRGRFRLRKVGHGGTLDPMATGLLVLLVGKATKFSDRVMGHDKTYEAVMRLGVSTDSQDADGEITAVRDASAVTADALRAQFAARLGDQLQTPPMVSARKINGVPLYKLARKGQEVERPPKLIHVYSFDLLSYPPPTPPSASPAPKAPTSAPSPTTSAKPSDAAPTSSPSAAPPSAPSPSTRPIPSTTSSPPPPSHPSSSPSPPSPSSPPSPNADGASRPRKPLPPVQVLPGGSRAAPPHPSTTQSRSRHFPCLPPVPP